MSTLNNSQKQNGIAMINVLIIVAMLTMLLLTMLDHNHANVGLANLVKNRAEAELKLTTAKNRVLFALMTQPASELILNRGDDQFVDENTRDSRERKKPSWNFFNLPFRFADATIKIQDQSALLHAVYPEPDRLNALLTSSMSQVQAARVFGSIIDWQDSDDNVSSNGAERSAYPQLANGIRNGGIPHVDDLRHVANITQGVLSSLKNNMSLYRGSIFNPMLAPKELLMGLYGEDRARIIDDLRQNGDLTQELFTSNTGFEESMISTLINSRTIALSVIANEDEAYAYESVMLSFNPNTLVDNEYVIKYLTNK